MRSSSPPLKKDIPVSPAALVFENYLGTIFSTLLPEDMVKLALVSKFFQEELHGDDVWSKKLAIHFPVEYKAWQQKTNNVSAYKKFKETYQQYYGAMSLLERRAYSAIRENDVATLTALLKTKKIKASFARDGSMLHVATRLGREQCVKALSVYKEHFDLDVHMISYEELNEVNAWELAVENGHIDILDFFIKKIGKNGKIPSNALIQAAFHHQPDALHIILASKQVSVNDWDSNGRSALFMAIYRQSFAMVEDLLKHGANVKYCTRTLHWAVPGDIAICQLLQQSGADIHAEVEGLTPLLAAARSGKLATVKWLVGLGSKIDKVTNDGRTLLHLAVESRDLPTIKYVFALFVSNNINIDIQNAWGENALYGAAASGQVETVEFLLTQSVVDSDKALKIAAANGQEEVVRVFLTKNASDLQSVIYAIQSGYLETVRVYIEFGLDVNQKILFNTTTLLMYALEETESDIALLLLENNADPNEPNNAGAVPLAAALEAGFSDVVEQLLLRGANVNPLNTSVTPLLAAINNSDLASVRHLIMNGADVNLKSASGKIPLHEAVQTRRLDIVEALLEAGANDVTEEVTGFKRTALSYAVEENTVDIAEKLLAKNKSFIDQFYYTTRWMLPVHVAAKNGWLGMVELLIENGAMPHVYDELKYTPYHYALVNNFSDILRFFHYKYETSLRYIEPDGKEIHPLIFALQHNPSCKDAVTFLIAEGRYKDLTTDEKNLAISLAIEMFLPDVAIAIINEIDLAQIDQTLLEKAIYYRSESIARKLVDLGVTLSMTTVGKERLHTAFLCKMYDMVLDIINSANDFDEALANDFMTLALDYNVEKLVPTLVRHGADVNSNRYYGKPLLNYAIGVGRVDFALSLIENRADIHNCLIGAIHTHSVALVQTLISKGFTEDEGIISLMFAIEYKDVKIAALLIEHGVVVNAQCNGESMLKRAIKQRDVAMVRLLLNNGVNVRALAHEELLFVAIEQAERNASLAEIVRLLLAHGCNAEHKNAKGETPLQYAQGLQEKHFFKCNEVIAILQAQELQNYITKTSLRAFDHYKTKITLFGKTIKNFGCSAGEKRAAAEVLQKVLKGESPKSELQHHQKALGQGELGKIYSRLRP